MTGNWRKGLAVPLKSLNAESHGLLGLFAKLHETFGPRGSLTDEVIRQETVVDDLPASRVAAQCARRNFCNLAWPVQSTYETNRTSTSHGIGEVGRLSVQAKSGGAGLRPWKIAKAV